MVNISSKIIFGDERLRKEFERLKETNEKEIYVQLVKAFNNLKENAFCGIQIPKRLIPKEYETKFGKLGNLWKYNLPNAWRLIYTIKNNNIEVLSILLEWMDHKEYERKFGY
jgi:Txe/YoeB family toxin of Txe-Axe toxin-antitoxin module